MGKKGKKKSKAADSDGNRASVDEKKDVVEPVASPDDQASNAQESEDVFGMFGSPNEEDKAAAAAEADSTVNGKAQDDASTDTKV